MDIQKIQTELLKAAKYNPRIGLKPGDMEFEKLKRSIEEFGFVELIVVNKRTEFTVISGHQRLAVLKHLRWTEVECVLVDLDEASEKALNIAMNKVSGEWDMPLLTDLLKDLEDSGFDVSLTGFEAADLDELLLGDPETEDDFNADEVLAEIEKPVTQLGDIWLLGKHKLLCGDATSSEDIVKLMDGQQCDLVLTDPPYNCDYEGATKDKLKILNDKMTDDKFLLFLTDAFTRMYEHSKKGAAIYIFHSDSEGYNFRYALKLAGYTLRQCLIWAKNSMVMGRQDYQWKHEPILYAWKDGAAHSWYSDRKQTTIVEFDKPHRNSDHPTMKPLGLVGYFIGNSSKTGDIVLDPFAGSFSTGIVCAQSNRICYGIELDSKYVDVSVSRYLEHAGNADRVLLVRDGKTLEFSDVKKLDGGERWAKW